jgi:hypothetical protein
MAIEPWLMHVDTSRMQDASCVVSKYIFCFLGMAESCFDVLNPKAVGQQ